MPAGKPTLVAPSSDAELLAVRRKCASALWALVPKGVGRLYFGGGLLRANSVSSLSRDKTEGSAELRRAAVNHLEHGDRSGSRDRGLLSLSSSSEAGLANQKARQIETAPVQAKHARGQEQQPRSGSSNSQSRSSRSAPAPWSKTGGQGSAAAAPAAATATVNVNVNVTALPGADPPPLPLSETTSASASEIDTGGGMASTGRPFATHRGGDEKGQGHGHQSQGPFHHQSGGYAARNDDDDATPAAAAENMAMDRDRGRGRDRDRDHQDKDGKRADNNNNSGQDEMVGEYSDEGGDDMGDGEGDSAGQDEAILMEIERGILDVFSDAYCNKHLVYGALELILVRLLPELTEKGALELWAERFSE
ncbi:hypothetical protein B0J18DRAFT_194550 [Chaetomium sp. MPI-SDFR-AT-0129]|nr:hypothetical protein B0J18DRAFT_194550 [Chaetomium sp. MPI-SDFR-AT-0129]